MIQVDFMKVVKVCASSMVVDIATERLSTLPRQQTQGSCHPSNIRRIEKSLQESENFTSFRSHARNNSTVVAPVLCSSAQSSGGNPNSNSFCSFRGKMSIIGTYKFHLKTCKQDMLPFRLFLRVLMI